MTPSKVNENVPHTPPWGEAACAYLHAFLLEAKIERKTSFLLNGDWCVSVFTTISETEMKHDFFLFHPSLLLTFCLLSLFSNAVMHGGNFPTYILINICIRQAPDYCTISIHITPLALMKQFCVLIPCDSECMTCCIRWNAQAKFNLQQSVMEICKMARFSVNERTIDNAIQLAAKATICIPVKGVIAWVAPEAAAFHQKAHDNTKSSGTKRKGEFGSLQRYSFNYSS